MRDLTITEQYVLMTLSKKGALLNYNRGFMVSSMIMDLKYEEFIIIDLEKNITINKELTEEFNYLHIIYNFIKEKGVINLAKLKSKFSGYSLLNNANKDSIALLKYKMLNDNLIVKVENKNKYIANEQILNNCVESLRASILEDEDLDDKTTFLLTLLKNYKIANFYFSLFENKKVKERIKDMKKNNTLFFKDYSIIALSIAPFLSGALASFFSKGDICYTLEFCCNKSLSAIFLYSIMTGAGVGLIVLFSMKKNIW